MQSLKIFGNSTFWGVAALVMTAVVAITAAVLYIAPPGYQAVVFYTDDAASVHSGDAVRIAGITVGKVKKLSIEPDRVKVTASVDKDAFVGDRSQVQVRMLTVVGGYYVNLVPLGEKPLGNGAIPVERVTMPYNLVTTLTDATKITDNVDTKPIRESLDEIQQGLTGTNVDSLRAVIEAGNTLTSTIGKQRGQITAILDLSDEYIESLKDFRGVLQEMVSKIAILEQTLVLYSKGFGASLSGLGDVGDALIAPVTDLYMGNQEEFLQRVRDWQDTTRRWADNNSRIIPRLRRVRDKIERVLDAQNAPPELLATDLCIPMPGSPC